jgi:hypothetical protein
MSDAHEGSCTCGKVRYELASSPMGVNCCHCFYCQRESGSAFAVNAMIEADRVQLITKDIKLEETLLPTQSGKPQRLFRCPDCKVVLWSLYGDNGDYLRFLKVGTLKDPRRMPAGINIYMESKQPWVNLEGQPAFPGQYDRKKMWPKESLDRFYKVIAKMKANKSSQTSKAKL